MRKKRNKLTWKEWIKQEETRLILVLLFAQILIMTFVVSMSYWQRTSDHYGAFFEIYITPCGFFSCVWLIGIVTSLVYRRFGLLSLHVTLPLVYPFVLDFSLNRVLGIKYYSERRFEQYQLEQQQNSNPNGQAADKTVELPEKRGQSE